jgi:hypothetical protein
MASISSLDDLPAIPAAGAVITWRSRETKKSERERGKNATLVLSRGGFTVNHYFVVMNVIL